MNAPDSLLGGLNERLLVWVEAILANVESASDTEVERLFVSLGITVEQAKRALEYRPKYLLQLYYQDQTPIRIGDKAVSLGSLSTLNQYL